MKHLFYVLLCVLVSTAFMGPYWHKKNDDPLPPTTYPKGYFQSPVAHDLVLSGTFGELRPNHFHSGIDISPGRGQYQEPIFAAAEGYVSRIRVQGGGYGQAIYIAHPNGYTTVYAHLDKFSTEIKAFVRRKQQESMSFEQDLYLNPTDLPVQKGQQIGHMGNRGHSFGAHLHFEVRHTASDKALNPLLFDFVVADTVAPDVKGMKLYGFTEQGQFIQSKRFFPIKKGYRTYALETDTLEVAASLVGFAFNTTDRHTHGSGNNGIFSIKVVSDGQLIYKYTAEGFLFDDTRYINTHTDYQEYQYARTMMHRTFLQEGNLLTMYDSVANRGLVSLQEGEVKRLTVYFGDIEGNETRFSVVLKGKTPLPAPDKSGFSHVLPYNEESVVKADGAVFYFPKGSFYETVLAQIRQDTEGGGYSPNYHVHDVHTPVHRFFEVAIAPTQLPEPLREKAFIGYCSREDGRIYNLGGKWTEQGFLTAKSNRFGNFSIMTDVVPPTIKVVSFAADTRKLSRFAFKIYDNYAALSSEVAGLRYRATVDGVWILMEYDAKNNLLYHNFNEGQIEPGNHVFRLEVSDFSNNVRVFEQNFNKK